MAFAAIPPHGDLWEAQKRREMIRVEQTTIDPVLRYRLREERIQRGLTAMSDAMISEARDTAKRIENKIKETR